MAIQSCILIGHFPSTITSIGTRPANNGCERTLVVICRAIVPPTFSGSLGGATTKLQDKPGSAHIMYLMQACLIYKSATGWSESASLIQALSIHMYEERLLEIAIHQVSEMHTDSRFVLQLCK